MNKIWCEVDKSTLKQNIQNIKKIIPNKKVIAVLKANAYGLGAKGVANVISKDVDMFAVSNLNEYKSLNTEKDVLLMSPLCSIDDFECNNKNLILSISNENTIDKIDKKIPYRVHLFVDTESYRMGIPISRLDCVINKIKSEFPLIAIEGIYTHFHNCSDENSTMQQILSFKNATYKYKDKLMIHCLASSSILNKQLREACNFTSAYRVGNLLYGFMGKNMCMKPCYKFKARVLHIESVKKDEFVGFGANYYKMKKDTIVGIIEAGSFYNVGCSRDSNKNIFIDTAKSIKQSIKRPTYVSHKGKKIDIIGNINMNSTVIDLTHNPNINVVNLHMSPVLADSSIEKIYI